MRYPPDSINAKLEAHLDAARIEVSLRSASGDAIEVESASVEHLGEDLVVLLVSRPASPDGSETRPRHIDVPFVHIHNVYREHARAGAADPVPRGGRGKAKAEVVDGYVPLIVLRCGIVWPADGVPTLHRESSPLENDVRDWAEHEAALAATAVVADPEVA